MQPISWILRTGAGSPLAYFADTVAVPKNRLQDIAVTREVNFVMLGGRVVKHPDGH
jgi:hypothetical protein|tara:strand:+ start:350 stop:517 length:168 start_codon:yes stop_codon:yes gene_type:complete